MSCVQISHFEDEADRKFGTSPWHYLSDTRYANSPTARTLWGVSLKYIYKYEMDGETFRLADHRKINFTSFSVGWNFLTLRDGRIVVPSPLGMRMGPERHCRSSEASLLVYRNGATSGSPIRCAKVFEFTPERVEAACGFKRGIIGTTGVFTDVLHDGSIAARIIRKQGDSRTTYLAVLDNALTRIKACAKVADGQQTNGSPIMRGSGASSVLYIPTETAIVAAQYNPADNSIRRVSQVPVPFRERTGTTPTIVEAGGKRWITVVEARCAVTNVFRGTIECDEGSERPSALFAIPLPLGSGEAIKTDLPEWLDTVENSPAAWGDSIVVANYSGYTPDGKKDGKRDFATGLVKLKWDEAAQRFVIAWSRPELQFSGVPTISGSSQMVYGTGSAADRQTYFYGLDLGTGAVRIRQALGASYSTRKQAGIFDAGNNLIVSDDGSAIIAGGESLVRLRDAP